ncbi:MAG: helix-turn-helix transcriptional regulator [Symploca sp. SIO2G7]|nr:helix-turn-helix transcriptional regulator [Symploca sp. SIO2G7]
MEFIKEIRQELGLNPYKMAKEMGIKTVQQYMSFEEAQRSVNIERLVKLWKLSGLDARAFMERMLQEVSDKQNKRKGVGK